MGEPDDVANWVKDSLAGDFDAYAALVEHHQKMVHAIAYRMTGSLADSQDLAQETFIRAYTQLGSFRGQAQFSTWLRRIVVNACLNWLAREGRRQRVHRQWTEDPTREDPGSWAHDGQDQLSRRVQSALMKLPGKQRAAIVLTLYEGMTHAEAAHALRCSETTVSWRVFAARAKLKRILKEPAAHE